MTTMSTTVKNKWMQPISFLLVFAMLGLSSCAGADPSGAQATADLSGSQAAPVQLSAGTGSGTAENSRFVMSIEPETSAITVTVKETGKVWRSMPTAEQIAAAGNDTQAAEIASQIVLKFYNDRQKEFTYDSYTQCIKKKQFTYSTSGSTIRVLYKIGRVDSRMLVPDVLTAGKFAEWMAKMTADEAEEVEPYYALTRLADFTGNSRSELIAKYPAIETQDLYIARKMPERIRKRVDEIFKAAGLTVEEMESGYDDLGYTPADEVFALFTIAMDYTLSDDGVKVSIPKDGIQYDRSLFAVNLITLNKYFGAQDASQEGFIFVPDGSGATIRYNKDINTAFYKEIYGIDRSFSEISFKGYSPQSIFPVYALVSEDNAVMAYIESGESEAAVIAGTSVAGLGFNYAGAEFTYTERESFITSKKNGAFIKNAPASIQTDLAIQYYFLTNEEASCSGMASVIRTKLFGNAPRLESGSDLPLYVESIGSIDKQETFLGFGYWAKEALTTYPQAGEIIAFFKQNGIDALNYKYTGWANGGMESLAPTGVKLIGRLGGKEAFSQLLSGAKDQDVPLYMNTEFNYVSSVGLFDGFSQTFDTAKAIDGTQAVAYNFSIETLTDMYSWFRYILSPSKYKGMAAAFIRAYDRFGNRCLSPGTIGSELNSDFSTKNPMTRPVSQQKQAELLKQFKDAGYNLLLNTPNIYSIPYASQITGLPVESGDYRICDTWVPLTSMVLHGYVNYSGEAVNLGGDIEKNILRAIDTGANLYYLLNYADESAVKGTYYTYLYSTQFETYKDRVLSDYAKVNDALKEVSGAIVTAREKIGEDAYMTQYDNGITIAVNYGNTAVTFNGYTVEPMGYTVRKS